MGRTVANKARFVPLLFLCYCMVGTLLLRGNAFPKEERGLFCTWEGFEADKCASIWLIKRFIDKNATIRFYPKGQTIREGIPFDTPEAEFRRYHNMSTFECLLKHFKLTDPRLSHIGEIIHDIEVNIWERKRFPETLEVQDAVNAIIQRGGSSEKVIRKSLEFFDSFYQRIK